MKDMVFFLFPSIYQYLQNTLKECTKCNLNIVSIKYGIILFRLG